MAKPVILAVDDPQVLRAVEQDLRRRYARENRVLRADSGKSALDTSGQLKLRDDPVAILLHAEGAGPAVHDPLPPPRQQEGYCMVEARVTVGLPVGSRQIGG